MTRNRIVGQLSQLVVAVALFVVAVYIVGFAGQTVTFEPGPGADAAIAVATHRVLWSSVFLGVASFAWAVLADRPVLLTISVCALFSALWPSILGALLGLLTMLIILIMGARVASGRN